MTRYVAKDEGFTGYKIIYQGRTKVGRVFKKADGTYGAFIGHAKADAPTEREAFLQCTAKAFGYSSPEAMRQHNAAVRAKKRQRTAKARAFAEQYLRADTATQLGMLDDLFGMERKQK